MGQSLETVDHGGGGWGSTWEHFPSVQHVFCGTDFNLLLLLPLPSFLPSLSLSIKQGLCVAWD